GSDVTLLFQLKAPELFRKRMDALLDDAAKSRPDAKRESGEYDGVPFVQVTTPDRAISVFSAYPAPNLHVRTNSVIAFRRVLDAIKVNGATRLGDSAEFAFIRTLLPAGAAEADGFVYLSDPLIRWLVSPKLKMSERRRM